MLKLSANLTLPLQSVTETFAILGRRGTGKTSTGVVLVEELLKAGQHVVVLDPVGVWHGLRSSKDGRSAGLPIVILGGQYADVPLPPTGCSPNNSGGSSHWRVKEGARAEYRAECSALLAHMHQWVFAKAVIRMEFFHGRAPGRYHAKDEQNAIAGVKALVDSLVDRGYLPGDDISHLHWGETVIHSAKESGERACVLVRLERTI